MDPRTSKESERKRYRDGKGRREMKGEEGR